MSESEATEVELSSPDAVSEVEGECITESSEENDTDDIIHERKTSSMIIEEPFKASIPGFNKNYLKNVSKRGENKTNNFKEDIQEFSHLIQIEKLGIGGPLAF